MMQAAMPETDAHQGFKVGGRTGDLYAGAAASYAAYRRVYPPAVVDVLVEQCGLDRRGRLLDAGCGTGQVFQVMAPYFETVLAIDPDPGMVAHARRAVADLGLGNVDVRQMRAEDIPADVAPLRAVIFGASFHWTDRPRVGDMVYDMLEPGGCLAVLSPADIHKGTTDWEVAIRDALARHLGAERRAGGGVYRAGELHQEALGRTRFRTIETVDIPVREQWSVEQILGYLASTSYASNAVLGDRAAAFESDLRRSLEALASRGPLDKVVDHTVIIARR
jgi:trans-aconitate methyltransferase